MEVPASIAQTTWRVTLNGVLVRGWLYQGQLEPVAELDGAGNVISRFVYASGSHVPDYMVKGGVTYHVASDHHGSPRLVINTATGTIAQRMDFDEWGNVTLDTAPGFQPFGFAGGIYDVDTGLTRFGARDYDPRVGRWTAKEPLGILVGGANAYSYCFNDPVNFIDISGEFAVNIVAGIVGGGVGGVVGGLTGGWKGALAGAAGGAVSGLLLNPALFYESVLLTNVVAGAAGSLTQAVITEGFEAANCGLRPGHAAQSIAIQTVTGAGLGLGGGIIGETAGLGAALKGRSDTVVEVYNGLAGANYTLWSGLPGAPPDTRCGCD